jgi:phosphate transport system permease protein
VLPVSLPAILTGSVLAVARAFGESAPLLLAGAVLSNFFSAPAGTSLWSQISEQSYTALPIVIFNWARQPQEEFVALTAAGIVVLLVVLLMVNAAAIIVRDRLERRQTS